MEILKTVDGEYLQQVGVFAMRGEDGMPLPAQPMYVKVAAPPEPTIIPPKTEEDEPTVIHEDIASEEICKFMLEMYKDYHYASITGKKRKKGVVLDAVEGNLQ